MSLFEQFILAKAYNFYPKGLIDSTSHEYVNSREFENLRRTCEFFYKNNQIWEDFISPLIQYFGDSFKDRSRKGVIDRSYCFDIIIDRERGIKTLTTNVSVLIPYYTTYIVDSSKAGLPPQISYGFNQNELKYKSVVDKRLKEIHYTEFPVEQLNRIIPDVAFNATPIGKFKVLEAFFYDIQERRG